MKSIGNRKRYAIKCNRLSFGYQKNDTCFSSANFMLEENEKAILISGGHLGKSTLIRILAGLEKGYVGDIKLLNFPESKFKLAYKNMVYIPERPVFLENKSVIKNLEFAYNSLYDTSKNMDYVLKMPNEFDGIEKINISKLDSVIRTKFELYRSSLKDIKLLLIDRSVNNIKKECDTRKTDFNKVKETLKQEYQKLIFNSNSVIIACEDYEDIKFYGAENFSVLYLSLGKIYKFRNLHEFEKNISNSEDLKYVLNRRNVISKLEIQQEKYYLLESNISSKKVFDMLLEENIKKRKIIDKNMKKYIKNGIYEQKCAEIPELFKRKILLKSDSNLKNILLKFGYISGDFFVSSYKLNNDKKVLDLNDSNFMLFDAISGERII